MPSLRSSSATDRLLADVRARGGEVTARQLERWRQAGLIPGPSRHGLGRGRGSFSSYAEGTAELVMVVAEAVRRHRDLDRAAIDLFMAGHPVPEAKVRRVLRAHCERWVPLGQNEDAFDQSESDAASLLPELAGDARGRAMLRRLGGGSEAPASIAQSVLTTVFHALRTGDALGEENVREVVKALGIDGFARADLGGLGPFATEERLTIATAAALRSMAVDELADAVESEPLDSLRGALVQAQQFLCLFDDLLSVFEAAGYWKRSMLPGYLRIDREDPAALVPVALSLRAMSREHSLDLDTGAAQGLHEQAHLLSEVVRSLPADLLRYFMPGGTEKLAELDADERDVILTRVRQALSDSLVDQTALPVSGRGRLAARAE